MTTHYIFDRKEIPIVIHRKNNRKLIKKEALYDTRTKKYITKFINTSFDPTTSDIAYKWWSISKGKYLLIENPEYQLLFIDHILKLKFAGLGRLSWMSGEPNDEYIVRADNDNQEKIISIDTGEVMSPTHGSIYPAVNFPQTPYYKATKNHDDRGDIFEEAIFHFPSGKQMTPYFPDISSIDIGFLGGKNDYYMTGRSDNKPTLWKTWNKKVITGIEYKDLEKITKELKGQLDDYKLIRNIFEELG